MDSEEKLKSVVRSIIKEEISYDERVELKNKLCSSVKQTVDKVLVRNDVHKKGLSEQQLAYLYKCIVNTVEDKLTEFTTKQKPKAFDNYEKVLDKYNL